MGTPDRYVRISRCRGRTGPLTPWPTRSNRDGRGHPLSRRGRPAVVRRASTPSRSPFAHLRTLALTNRDLVSLLLRAPLRVAVASQSVRREKLHAQARACVAHSQTAVDTSRRPDRLAPCLRPPDTSDTSSRSAPPTTRRSI